MTEQPVVFSNAQAMAARVVQRYANMRKAYNKPLSGRAAIAKAEGSV